MFHTREEIRDAEIRSKESAQQSARNLLKFNRIWEAQDQYWEQKERAEELCMCFPYTLEEFVGRIVRDHHLPDVEFYTKDE